jgi:hypothetical protein
MDILGQVLWYLVFLTPLITIPITWQLRNIRKIYRVLLGLLIALVLSILLCYISLEIIFRDGMGPA